MISLNEHHRLPMRGGSHEAAKRAGIQPQPRRQSQHHLECGIGIRQLQFLEDTRQFRRATLKIWWRSYPLDFVTEHELVILVDSRYIEFIFQIATFPSTQVGEC
jgi:hypothetical protein